ncbi:MAG: PfkB family carbohydrate kinase [Chloroflexota bacterium]
MRDFSLTGIPTKDYYDFHGEAESRIMFGSTAIYASAALANQGADLLFSGPIGTDLDKSLLAPLTDVGIKFELHEMAGQQAWLRLVFAEGGRVTFFEIDMGVGESFRAEQLTDNFWQARVCWIGTCPHHYKVGVATLGQQHGCEVGHSPQGEFGRSLDEFGEVVEQLNFINTNTAEMASLGKGQLMQALNNVREINPNLQILLTRGRNGAWFIRQNEIFSIPAIPQVESEFLVGAGDTFAATFHYHRIQGNPIPVCLQRATAAAVLKIRGFSYTTMGNLDQVLAKTEELAPQLPVKHAAWGSPLANRWIEQEEPDWTQFGPQDGH